MITLKKWNVFGQLILILTFFFLTVCFRNQVYVLGLFTIGFWQVLSVVIHLSSKKSKVEVSHRKYYRVFLVVSVATLPFGSFCILPLIAPITAIRYFAISFRELRIWQHRHFIQLR